jgi:inhibitor of the pro-sigma K processing machinery
MDWKMLLLGGIGLFGLYLVGSALITPLRFLIRIAAALLLGGLLLVLVNWAGSIFHFHIAVNPITMLAAGAYPVPGLILLGLLRLFVV